MSPSILYIEDEEDYQILVKQILKRAGLSVRTASTAEEGCTELQKEMPSLLLLDINLPDANGYEICQRLRSNPLWQKLPILILTIRRRPDEWLRGFASGATDYIPKPIDPAELVERVVSALEGNRVAPDPSADAEYLLVRSATRGNRAAFEVLIHKYKKRLAESLGATIRNDALLDDVMAYAFTTAYERLPEFRGDASFFTWLFRIAHNRLQNTHRKTGMVSLEDFTTNSEDYMESVVGTLPADENALADQELGREALETLKKVPFLYRRVLELFFLKDLSYDAIAKRLRIPRGTVMSRLHKGRKLLQEAWTKIPAESIR